MISQEDAEKSVDWMKQYSHAAAKARAERLYIEQWLKTVLAQEMAKHADQPLGVQEREARISEPYIEALKAYREAVEMDERIRNRREAESTRVAAWQTESANERATRI